jgi:hypothetical protein
MTAQELIEALQKLPPETHIFTSGYEGGYNDASTPVTIRDYALNWYNAEDWWLGPHQLCEDNSDRRDAEERDLLIVKGVSI